MKFKKLFLVCIFLLVILIIGGVSANDNMTSDDLNVISSVGDDSIGLKDGDSLEKTYESNLSASGDIKNLNVLIKNVKKGSEIKLTHDYTYNKDSDSNFEDGIVIDKALTINGNGHTINGKNKRIFTVNEANVVIKNVIFKNTRIDIDAPNCSIVDCKFINSNLGIYLSYNAVNCNVVSCNFQGCSAESGGAIYSNGEYNNIINCSFTGCSASYEGGAIYSTGSNSSFEGCNFVNCSADDGDGGWANSGGAMYLGYNCTVVGCSFKNCHANDQGDAIFFFNNFKLIDSSFTNGAWYGGEAGFVSNVLVDNNEYGGNFFTDLKGNQRIVLKKDYVILSPIPIEVDNLVIDGNGHYFTGNGIFRIYGKNVTIMNCNFKNCTTPIYSNGNYTNVLNCDFKYCNAEWCSGAIYSSGNYSNAVNCTFMKCGGAVEFDGDNSSVISCAFKDCFEEYGYGSAVYTFYSNNLSIINSTFTSCNELSGEYAAAVYSGFDCTCNIAGCSFKDCYDSEYKCAVFFGGNFSIVDSSFINGAWYGERHGFTSNVYIDNKRYCGDVLSNLKENETIVLTRDFSLLSPVSIDVNNVVVDGDGMYLTGHIVFYITGDNVTIMNCNFKDCSASDTGAIYSIGGYTNLVNCRFRDCSASFGDAGAVYLGGDNSTVIDCNFIKCSCNDDDGGAIYSVGNHASIVNCEFTSCSAWRGAALYSNAIDCNVVDCSFTDFSAAEGGSIYSNSSLSIFNSTFTDSSAREGGAVYCVDNLTVVGCNFKDCSAYCWFDYYDFGGAIYCGGNSSSVSDSTFMNCSSADDGGAIFSSGNMDVFNCSFRECSALYGDAIFFADKFTISNSSFDNGVWYGKKGGKVSNVSINGNVYDIGEFDNLTENGTIVLTKDYSLTSPISIDADNAVVDGAGHSIKGNVVFYITGSNVTIMNLNFRDCFSRENGGAIYSGGDNLHLVNCSFINCSSHGYSDEYSADNNSGGAIYSCGENVSIIGCSFKDCSSAKGDAIYFKAKFSLINSSFVNGTWYNEKGGYVFNVSVDNKAYDVDVFNNINDNDRIVLTKDYSFAAPVLISADNVVVDGAGYSLTGSMIFSISGENVTIMNCNFADCFDGAINSSGNNVYVVNCSFINSDKSVKRDDDGNIYYDRTISCSGDWSSVVNCSFINCSGIYLDCVNGTVVNCDFSQCSNRWGSAILLMGVNSTVSDCSFLNCHASGYVYLEPSYSCYGGAIGCGGNYTDVIRCSFTDCSACYGGAIHSSGNNLSVIDCSFEKCHGQYQLDWEGHYDHGGFGGAIYGADVVVSECSFVKCYAGYFSKGGAICSEGIVSNCTFINCSVGYDDLDYWSYGGAVYGAVVSECSFTGCSAGFGGSVYSYMNKSSIANSVFKDSSAYRGGAIYSDGDGSSVANCVFINCIDENSVAIYTGNSNGNIVNCTFMIPKITASNLKMYYNDGSYFKVKVYNADGSAASGISVVFKLDGKNLKTVKTDKNGVAKVKITSLPKTYKISATAFKMTVTKTLTVKKVLSLKKVKVKKSAKKLTLTATLKKVKGKYLKGKKITIKFNGKTYKAKTNKKGVAKVTIKESVLKKLKVGKKIKYQATYVKSTVKYTVKVSK